MEKPLRHPSRIGGFKKIREIEKKEDIFDFSVSIYSGLGKKGQTSFFLASDKETDRHGRTFFVLSYPKKGNISDKEIFPAHRREGIGILREFKAKDEEIEKIVVSSLRGFWGDEPTGISKDEIDYDLVTASDEKSFVLDGVETWVYTFYDSWIHTNEHRFSFVLMKDPLPLENKKCLWMISPIIRGIYTNEYLEQRETFVIHSFECNDDREKAEEIALEFVDEKCIEETLGVAYVVKDKLRQKADLKEEVIDTELAQTRRQAQKELAEKKRERNASRLAAGLRAVIKADDNSDLFA